MLSFLRKFNYVRSGIDVAANGTEFVTLEQLKLFNDATKCSPDNVTIQQSEDGVYSVKKGGITGDNIADGAVTTDKIADGSITSDKLFDNGSVPSLPNDVISLENQFSIYTNFNRKTSIKCNFIDLISKNGYTHSFNEDSCRIDTEISVFIDDENKEFYFYTQCTDSNSNNYIGVSRFNSSGVGTFYYTTYNLSKPSTTNFRTKTGYIDENGVLVIYVIYYDQGGIFIVNKIELSKEGVFNITPGFYTPNTSDIPNYNNGYQDPTVIIDPTIDNDGMFSYLLFSYNYITCASINKIGVAKYSSIDPTYSYSSKTLRPRVSPLWFDKYDNMFWFLNYYEGSSSSGSYGKSRVPYVCVYKINDTFEVEKVNKIVATEHDTYYADYRYGYLYIRHLVQNPSSNQAFDAERSVAKNFFNLYNSSNSWACSESFVTGAGSDGGNSNVYVYDPNWINKGNNSSPWSREGIASSEWISNNPIDKTVFEIKGIELVENTAYYISDPYFMNFENKQIFYFGSSENNNVNIVGGRIHKLNDSSIAIITFDQDNFDYVYDIVDRNRNRIDDLIVYIC